MNYRTILLVGHAKLPQKAAAHSIFGTMAVTTLVDKKYGVIINASATLTNDNAREYFNSLLTGHSLLDGVDNIIRDISEHYFGSTQDTLIAAIKDIYSKYLRITSNN